MLLFKVPLLIRGQLHSLQQRKAQVSFSPGSRVRVLLLAMFVWYKPAPGEINKVAADKITTATMHEPVFHKCISLQMSSD